MEWQPIETAPKDGRVILVYDHGPHWAFCAVLSAYWDAAAFDGDEDEDEDNQEHKAGWVVFSLGDGEELMGCNLTHWMPLPEPPK